MTDLDLMKKFIPKNKQDNAIKKLKEGYPVQYLIGNVDFMGININVDERVLIPRFETEYLVDKTIKYLKKLKINNLNVLEIGTGSGCISIALQKLIECNITSIDISNNAIDLAKINAKNNNVEINFINKDIKDYKTNDQFDLIISNPPYVSKNKEVDKKTKYEPQNAIFADDNGLYFYNLILNKLKQNLKENYLIAFEIDDKQGSNIKEYANKYLDNPYILIEKDLNNLERYVFISNKPLED